MNTRSLTFARKIAGGFAIPLILLAFLGLVAYNTTTQLIDSSHTTNRSREFLVALHELQGELEAVQSDTRGYALTGNKVYISDLRGKDALVVGLVRQLEEASDNREDRKRIADLRPAVEDIIGRYTEIVQARDTGGLDAAVGHVTAYDAYQSIVKVRKTVYDLEETTRKELKARQAADETLAGMTKTTILLTTIIGFVLVLVAAYLITRSLNKQIGSAIQDLQSSATELQSAANQQASSTTEQASALNEVATTLKELLATSRQIAESSQRVTRVAEETATAARAGDLTLARAQEANGTVRRQVDLIVSHMLDLGKKSQEIGGILDVVGELAEQTNILAINATIESAGAGEAGRRFGAVAEEIRKLADRVGNSTRDIRTLIEEIRAAANTTVMTTEDGSKAVEAGARQFSDVASSFRQIATSVETTSESAREIELSTKQQATAVEQVNSAIASSAQAAKETESSARQTLQTSSVLAALSHDLALMIRPGSNN